MKRVFIPLFFLLSIIFAGLSACNNSNDIPLPENTTTQPIITPLHFSTARNVKFSDTTPIHIKTQKLNFNNLPEQVFDSSGFKPFAKPPTVTHFNWDSLPETTFNYDSLPSKPLKFENAVLNTPKVIQANILLNQGSNMVYDLKAIGALTGKDVFDILQDNNGFLWFSAADGLYRYDGTKLTSYASTKFSGDYWSLLQDKKVKYGLTAVARAFICLM